MRVGIYGTGAYGMALASVLYNNDIDVTMWTKFENEKEELESTRRNELLLPNYLLPNEIKITNSVYEGCKDKDLIIIAIPAAFVTDLCIELKRYIKSNQHICIASKGIEQKTGLFIHNIVSNYIDTSNIAVISGPSFAKDMITKNPIGLSLATINKETEKIVKEALNNNYLKLRTNNDIVGTEICGSIKNVIALASGMLEGLGTNDSTRAMLITEALHDMGEIITAFEGNSKTVLSFAGFGDLLLTCTSTKSRNFSFGKIIGQGASNEEIENYLKNHTVEGYYTLESIYQLLRDKDINIPIIDLIYNIIKKDTPPKEILTFLVEKV